MIDRKIIIFDTTLRDGIQDLDAPEERVAEALGLIDGLDVDWLEVGLVNRQTTDLSAVRRACQAVRHAGVCCLAFPDANSIERAGQVLSGMERGRIHTFNSVAVRANGQDDAKTVANRVEEISRTVSTARHRCADVEWAARDATRSDPDFLCRCAESAAKAGASTINIADTRGTAVPDEMTAIVRDLKNRVPNADRFTISVHCHNDLGLATANSLAAILAGADEVECTLGGLGPRGGNASSQQIVAALVRRSDVFRRTCTMDLERLAAVGGTALRLLRA